MRRLVLLICCAVLLLCCAGPAFAGDGDPTIGGQTTGQGIGLDGTQGGGNGGTGTAPVSTGPVTRSVTCNLATGAATGDCAPAATCQRPNFPPPTNVAVTYTQQADGSWRQTGVACDGPNGQDEAVVTAAVVREQVIRLLPPVPVGVAPADGPTLVNLETVVWAPTAATRQLGPVTVLGQSVAITVRLDHVDWTFGDGATMTTTHPGTAWTEHACDTAQCPTLDGHTYTTATDPTDPADTRTITATLTWTATFTVGAGAPQPIPGTVTGPTTTHDLTVRQGRTVITR